jgi:hypothetical protein
VIVSGGCHCGALRFQPTVADDAVLLDCNCSMRAKTMPVQAFDGRDWYAARARLSD